MARTPPRVCLLHDGPRLGGVATIVQELHDGLHDAGWAVDTAPPHPHAWRTARHADVLLATHSFGPAYAAWALGQALGKPWVAWVHGPLQEVLDEARSTPAKRAWLRWLYRRVPRFVFISRHARTSLEGFLGQPLPDARAHVIPNALRLPRAPLRTAPTASGTVELGYVGRLSPEKQPERLIAMLRLLPPRYRLSLVGDGPLRAALEQQAADLAHTERLAFCGARPRATALAPDWRLTLLASRYEGGCPLSAIESAAAGIPFVAPPLPALRETVPACLLAPGDSPAQLAAAVQQVLALPSLQIQRALDSLLARHAVPRFTDQWQQVLREAAAC